MRHLRTIVAGLCAALLLAGCNREKPLPGQRYDVRAPITLDADGDPTAVQVAQPDGRGNIAGNVPISLPAPVNHTEWTHRGGSPLHRVTQAALGAPLTLVWSADIGDGNTRRTRLSADPVVAANRVFTLDSENRVTAISTGGAPLWSRALAPASGTGKRASGGGLAIGEGRLFVSTGFGELFALDPATGQTVWVQRFDSPVSGAPTVRDGLVYVSSRDNRAFAVRVADGLLEWQLPAAPSPAATVNGSGPAVTDRVAVFPFSSTELIAVLRRGGIQVWSSILAGQRRGHAYAGVTDISSDPVVAGDTVYAGSPSGRIAAIDINNGERIWTATEGAMSPVWVEGGSVFAVTDTQQLVRLNGATGEVIWAVDLPQFKNTRPRRYRDVYAHYGPVMASGRLLVASDDGFLRGFDPRNGALVSQLQLPAGAASNPVIVNRTLYLITVNGKLLAFR